MVSYYDTRVIHFGNMYFDVSFWQVVHAWHIAIIDFTDIFFSLYKLFGMINIVNFSALLFTFTLMFSLTLSYSITIDLVVKYPKASLE